jgi:hypothetical protein
MVVHGDSHKIRFPKRLYTHSSRVLNNLAVPTLKYNEKNNENFVTFMKAVREGLPVKFLDDILKAVEVLNSKE